MTPKTPKEALAQIRLISGVLLEHEINAIFTALKPWLDNQRTAGTFEVCELCGRAASLLNKIGCGKLYDIHGERECPIKQVTNEKA